MSPSEPDTRFDVLSGGNMQRVLAGRELAGNPCVLIAINPVQGLDARTALQLWSRFRQLADAGSSVLILTTDLEEGLEHGNRIGVIHEGRVSAILPTYGVDSVALGSMMVNGW